MRHACVHTGGFLMSWVDEYWKGSKSQATCKPTYSDAEFSPKTCDLKAPIRPLFAVPVFRVKRGSLSLLRLPGTRDLRQLGHLRA